MSELNATHKGWFLFCPVYLNMDAPDCPDMWARMEWMEPLLTAAHWCQEAMIGFLSHRDEGYEPGFVIHITGEVASR